MKNLTQTLSNEEIDKIIYFFQNNYIVGKEEKKMEDLKDFNIKELSNLKKK